MGNGNNPPACIPSWKFSMMKNMNSTNNSLMYDIIMNMVSHLETHACDLTIHTVIIDI